MRSPEFKLAKTKGRLSRRIFRQRIAQIQNARQNPELEKLARTRRCMSSDHRFFRKFEHVCHYTIFEGLI